MDQNGAGPRYWCVRCGRLIRSRVLDDTTIVWLHRDTGVRQCHDSEDHTALPRGPRDRTRVTPVWSRDLAAPAPGGPPPTPDRAGPVPRSPRR